MDTRFEKQSQADLLKLCQDGRQHLSQLIHGGILIPAHTSMRRHFTPLVCVTT